MQIKMQIKKFNNITTSIETGVYDLMPQIKSHVKI